MANDWQLKAVLSAKDNMSPALKAIGVMAKSTRKYLSDIVKSAGNVSGKIGLPLAAVSGVLGGFSLAAVKNAVVGFADLGEEIHKGSLRTGIAVEQYQKMKYVAEQSGVGVEMLDASMGKLNLNMAKAAVGKNKSVSALFKRMGIDIRDANHDIKKGIDVLPQISDAFVRNDSEVRDLMGMALFGKRYQEMLPLLMQGSEGISESLDRMKRFKGVMSKEDIEGAVGFAKSLRDLSYVSKGFSMVIAKSLAPVIKPLIDDFANWTSVNKELIKTNVAKMAKDLGNWIKTIDFTEVLKGVQGFIGGLGTFVDAIGGAKNALLAIIVVMNAQTIMALVGLAASIWRAGFAFVAMAAQAYIAGNAGMLSMMRVAAVALFTAGPLGVLGAAFSWMGSLAAGAGGIISGAMGIVKVAIRGVGAALMANPLGVILAIASAAFLIYENWGTLKEWFSSFFTWIGEKFKVFLGWAKDLASMVSGMFGSGDSAGPEMSQKTAPLGGMGVIDQANSRGNGERPSLISPVKQQVGGKFTFDFQNAPQGMRVAGIETKGNTDVDMNVGTRSYAFD